MLRRAKIAGPALWAVSLWAQTAPVEIVRRAAANARRGVEARLDYSYTVREEVRRLDSSGRVKSADVTVTSIAPVYGLPVERPLAFNGGSPTPRQQRLFADTVAKLKNHSAEERARRRAAALREFDFIGEAPDAMRFRLAGQEKLDGRPVWVIEAVPLPAYRARTREGRVLSKVHALAWIETSSWECVRIEATVDEAFPMASMFVRLLPGSRISVRLTEVPGGFRMPSRLDLRAHASVLYFLGQAIESTTAYSDYRPAVALGAK